MKKRKAFLLLAIFIVGASSVAIPTVNLNGRIENSLDSSDESQMEKTSSPAVVTKITQENPPGHLTGGIFFSGLEDIDGGGFDNLKIDIEVEITSTTPRGYAVMAELYDRTFQRRYYNPSEDRWNFDQGYYLWGNSSFQALTSGIYNVTVSFNCTQLRALKLAGPYAITYIQLVNGTYQNHDMVHEEWSDNHYENPLFIVPQIFDIYTFDEPDETGSFVLHDATLTDFLEVNVTFQSFSHWENNDEDYYIRLVLRNSTGSTIGHWEQAISGVPSNKLNNVKLKIPVTLLGAFDFGGASYPTLSFEEVAIVQLHGRGPFDIFNMLYASSPYSVSTIDVSLVAQVQTLISGSYPYGSLAIGDRKSFCIFPQNSDDVLHLEVDRVGPWENDPPDFDVWYLDGFGRSRDLWHRDIIFWEEWWDDLNTDHYLLHIGRYQGPWIFTVKHNDHGQPPETTQDLTVRVGRIQDITPPSVSYISPSDGDSFMQYYGIPIQGIGIDQSNIIMFQILVDGKILFTYRPFEMYWSQPPIDDDFYFVWFPSNELLYAFDLVIRAYDMTYQFSDAIFSITINPGTKPSPESTINKGLDWLKTQQLPDGSWDYNPGEDWGNPGMAALGALCFIQAGQSDDPIVKNAINYLRNRFGWDGSVSGQSIYMNTYMTSMATTTLIAYNATLPVYDSDLDSLIEDAILWLVDTQNDENWGVDPTQDWYGGWRYGDDHGSSDLSVSQWAILALATYETVNPGGLDAYDPYLWEKVDTFVRRCRGGYEEEDTWIYDGGFTYTPYAEDWRKWGGGSYGSMTAAGIWGLYLSGSELNDTDIVSALDWINNTNNMRGSDEIVDGNPHQGRSFEYYWYLSASKAFLMAGREEDQWWYDEITEYLNTHMVHSIDYPSTFHWDNTMGGEPPVFATVQAILSQQVFYGHMPTHELEVTLETVDGSAMYLWNSAIGVGYNYTTGLEETSSGTSYSGLLEDKQVVSILSPTKGEYFIDVYPAAGDGGISSPQDMVLRARALTDSGHVISYKTEVIDYQDTHDYPQLLRYKMVLTTISGLDIHFLWDGYEYFTRSVNFDGVDYPTYVELNEVFDVTLTLTNIGEGTISAGTVLALVEGFSDQSNVFTNWAQSDQKQFSFHYSTLGLPAGIRTIVISLIAEDTTPLLIRIKVQIGNRAPEGTLDDIDDVISGTETISWNSSDPDGDDLTFKVILVLPDGTEVELKTGTSTSYSFDTTAYPDDNGYQIIIEISDGTDTVYLTSDTFDIMNTEEDTSIEGTGGPSIRTPGFEFIFSLLALCLIMVWFRRKK
ncbi:MAG: hypothetical protein ACXADY_02475 [Candidatus Hodarchaeales archaeon]